ncbi:hypothetical protein L1987_72919 [Smallanthus sonchifolius]|uniref:Uncharacterized protein n=1 Tax=Smallanthus sonchifolius TaxID=185202 RepID=A0ACB9AVQ7_9ASTR|nr:hypothetical protein L1987_72919 [Smallanthus sonchifolius]
MVCLVSNGVSDYAKNLLQGQCFCAGSRTFVHERVYDEFLEKAKARAVKRVCGTRKSLLHINSGGNMSINLWLKHMLCGYLKCIMQTT